jgi:dCMP deaminase
MARPSLDETFLDLARVLARRGSCVKRQVGCVLVDDAGHVVATAWNGRPKPMGNCDETPCAGGCEGLHAEMNALQRSNGKARTAYVTHFPCWHCAKALAGSSVTRVVCISADSHEARSARLLTAAGIKHECLEFPDVRDPSVCRDCGYLDAECRCPK